MHTEIWRAVFVGLFCALFGFSLGYPFEVILTGLIVYMAWTFRTIEKLFRWIDKGMAGIPPDADGVCGEITDTLNRQRRRHRRGQEKMRRTINRITRLTEALDEGILVLRSDLMLDWWNSSATKLLGLRSTDRLTAVTNLIRDPVFVSYIAQKEFVGSIKLSSSDQVGATLQLSASYFGDDEIVLVITDITRLSNLEQLRKEFVGNVSHELRTPLTVMRGYLETLEDVAAKDPLLAKAFAQMSNQVSRMQGLSDDLIMISRLESDDHQPILERINLKPMLEEIVAEAKVLGDGTHTISLVCHQDPVIEADVKDIRSVFGNIIFNAVRHNPRGANIIVRATSYTGFINISVKDDGIGIDPNEIPRLTERFYRGDSSRNSETGGSGLGLAIVKHALARNHGQLIINSRLGQGAEFVCRLPLQNQESPAE
jgi:two-component system, OmpR family, phosphate regulon sensor histidine kinase PhoR